MMNDNHPDASHGSGWRQVILTLFALIYVITADYSPLALSGVTCVFFLVYIALRLVSWFDNDRFTPRRLRVGVTWALVGMDSDAEEYDTGPVRTYFSLLLILFVGLVIRPVVGPFISYLL